jgi:hypothetical protein
MKPKYRRSLLLLLLVAGCCVLPSCTGVADAYVKADRVTYDAIAPESLVYVAADPKLTAPEKERRGRTVETWRIRTETGEVKR